MLQSKFQGKCRMKNSRTTIRKLFWGILMIALLNSFSGVKAEKEADTLQDESSPIQWYTRAQNFQRTAFIPDELALPHGQLYLNWDRFLGERIEVEMEPVIVEDYLFIGLMNGKMYALDKDTGKTIWIYDTHMGITDSPSAFSINGMLKLFFGSTNGSVYCLDAQNGELIWEFKTGGPIMSSPSIEKDTLYIGSLDKNFYALDMDSGSLLWSFPTNAPISTTSAIGQTSLSKGKIIYFSNGENTAFALDDAGNLIWKYQMAGVYTKRTYTVFTESAVIFTTRKPGGEYSEPIENRPSALQGQRQPGDVVIEAWASFYQEYPERRTLYFLDPNTGEDLWNPAKSTTNYAPIYIPYWGEIMPVVNSEQIAYFPATGSGGDHSLDHDIRLWSIDLKTGEYTHLAYQNEFSPRMDEVGRPSLIGNRYFFTMSEDVGYYDLTTKELNSNVFGDTFSVHSAPLEFTVINSESPFSGMEKQFLRFSSSSPMAFAGAADAASPLVVSGGQAFYTAWGHIYSLSTSPKRPELQFDTLDLMTLPDSTVTLEEAQQMLNEQISEIIESQQPIYPVSRYWSWNKNLGTFWHEGEVVRSLSETIPFLDPKVANKLKLFLKKEVDQYLLNPTYYEYRWACLDYKSKELLDPCDQDGIQAGWFWSNPNLISERLYAIYKYAQNTNDWVTIDQSWPFIKEQYNKFNPYWDDETGFYLYEEWQAGPFNPSLQMGAELAINRIASRMGDLALENQTKTRLDRMIEKRVYWGKYVRNLYPAGILLRNDLENWQDWGYVQWIKPLPVDGYLDADNDYRQVYSIQKADGEIIVEYDNPRYLVQPLYLVGFHPFYEEFNDLIKTNLKDELADYIEPIELIAPTWYMGDYSHASGLSGYEDDSFSPTAASDIFQAKAYILDQDFDRLFPYLPWTFENYDSFDIYRVQNLTALLKSNLPKSFDGQNSFGEVEEPYINFEAFIHAIKSTSK